MENWYHPFSSSVVLFVGFTIEEAQMWLWLK